MRLWEQARAEFTRFLAFDGEIRRIVCAANPSSFRRASGHVVPDDIEGDSYRVAASM